MDLHLHELLMSGRINSYTNIRIRGLMGMASFSEDQALLSQEFSTLKTYFDKAQQAFPDGSFDTLSMGMSSDYALAISKGSNMVRIGSLFLVQEIILQRNKISIQSSNF
jgi:PLP dependent protein